MRVKVLISTDMEGVAGVTHLAQCRPSHADYPRFRRLLTYEVNAAVDGAFEGGADEVVVNDAHFMMTNIIIEELDPRSSLISGSNKLLCQMEGIDQSVGAVFFVGYHEGDGDGDGVVNHTLMSATIRCVRVNGASVDEATLNALVAADYGVPVALVTGDDRVCAAAAAHLRDVEVAPVKRAIDRLSAESRSVESARALIRDRARAAVHNVLGGLAPLARIQPAHFEIEFRSSSCANMCTLIPNVQRTGPRTVEFEQSSMTDAYRLFWGLALLGMATLDGAFGSD
jgi:D-amino peptidase